MIVDETANISVKDQVPTVFQIVQKNFEIQVPFCGLFITANSRATALFGIVKDLLCFAI